MWNILPKAVDFKGSLTEELKLNVPMKRFPAAKGAPTRLPNPPVDLVTSLAHLLFSIPPLACDVGYSVAGLFPDTSTYP